jgi:hypothetical protein
MYAIENKSITTSKQYHQEPSLSLHPSKKTRAELSWENYPSRSLDLSHQTTVIWLIHGLRRTRRELNGGFITQGVIMGVSVIRYTTQPIAGK